jgi:hypothetical protein
MNVTIFQDERMHFEMYWQAMIPVNPTVWISSLNLSGDSEDSYFVLDDIGNRYNPIGSGGAVGKVIQLNKNEGCSGWLDFPPIEEGARIFSLHYLIYNRRLYGNTPHEIILGDIVFELKEE